MRKKIRLILKNALIMVMLFNFGETVAGTGPKHEFRAVWVATVVNIDWPLDRDHSTATQKQNLISLFDNMQACGMNVIIFQVRPACDAFYQSSYEPWSFWLTGEQGMAPSPFYDPLQFAVEEAHKRGMELHAWFNPYRAEVSSGSFTLHSSHVINQHPEWILNFGSLNLLDPGLPMARNYVTNVIMDVVHRYDIDGVHFDDYFYPYSGITDEDSVTFTDYPRGFTNIADWRRDNVNLLIEQVFDSIKAAKNNVKFGISPFGIWKIGIPEGTTAYIDCYDYIYCDPLYWLDRQIIDYLTPQIYWQFGYDQDYGLLMPWWAGNANGRHIYPGHAAYKISGWGLPSEMPNQVRANRTTENVYGSVFFSAKQIRNNPLGFRDSLRTDLYRYQALQPVMTWLDSVAPQPPQNLAIIDDSDGITLQWESPLAASDGDTSYQYVIYRATGSDTLNIHSPQQIITILSAKSRQYTDRQVESGVYYAFTVTNLDRISNESIAANRVDLLYTGLNEIFAGGPSAYTLEQNYPNPFNPKTVIAYQLSAVSQVELSIYNILGQRVAILVNERQQAGYYQIEWDASGLPSGVYYYRIIAGEFQEVKKMMLVK